MIFIALGANLPSKDYGSPRETLLGAIKALEAKGVFVEARSRWYESAAYPPSDQPDYVNAVIAVKTDLPPRKLLSVLHAVERGFGRVRHERNEARVVDLDLIDYHGEVVNDELIVLPHPRMHLRAFVLQPLADIALSWRHPVLAKTTTELIEELLDDGTAKVID
jgi:2-amino-4-hydroxy-6-hydroxymethyldihydropteridine diphosphokinase